MSGGPQSAAWRGAYVETDGEGNWRFYRCLRCDKNLNVANDEGYGPECKKHRPLDWRSARREALKADREAYRRDHSPTRGGKPPSAKQLAYIAALARRKGIKAPQVRSRVEASIDRALERGGA